MYYNQRNKIANLLLVLQHAIVVAVVLLELLEHHLEVPAEHLDELQVEPLEPLHLEVLVYLVWPESIDKWCLVL